MYRLTVVKKKMTTRYGQIHIANSQPFSCHFNGFGISPFLQEKLVLLGQLEVYDQAARLTHSLLGVCIGASQIYRLTNHYGAAIEAELDQPMAGNPPSAGVVSQDIPDARTHTVGSGVCDLRLCLGRQGSAGRPAMAKR